MTLAHTAFTMYEEQRYNTLKFKTVDVGNNAVGSSGMQRSVAFIKYKNDTQNNFHASLH